VEEGAKYTDNGTSWWRATPLMKTPVGGGHLELRSKVRISPIGGRCIRKVGTYADHLPRASSMYSLSAEPPDRTTAHTLVAATFVEKG
jgi:hypothetical protein